METKYYCPACGAELEQGQYDYDYETGNLVVMDCPECGCSGELVKMEE